jgi:hypothetical protein
MAALASWGPALLIVLTVILGVFYQTHHFDNKRFDDLKDLIKSEIKRLEDRIERLEHPVVRP